jgi:hypothetical protein
LAKEVVDDEKIELSARGRRIAYKLKNKVKGTEGIFDGYI